VAHKRLKNHEAEDNRHLPLQDLFPNFHRDPSLLANARYTRTPPGHLNSQVSSQSTVTFFPSPLECDRIRDHELGVEVDARCRWSRRIIRALRQLCNRTCTTECHSFYEVVSCGGRGLVGYLLMPLRLQVWG
jgi:hypothetical protein